jgi:hypothetical protein
MNIYMSFGIFLKKKKKKRKKEKRKKGSQIDLP